MKFISGLFNRFRLRGKDSLKLYLLVFIYLVAIILFFFERSMDRERNLLIERFRDFTSLAEEYRMIKASNVPDISNSVSEGLLQSINRLVDSTGIRERVKSLKMTGNHEFKGIVEETVEMDVDKLTMNELINLLYRIENHQVSLSIKDVRMKKDFENPERIDVGIRISLFRNR